MREEDFHEGHNLLDEITHRLHTEVDFVVEVRLPTCVEVHPTDADGFRSELTQRFVDCRDGDCEDEAIPGPIERPFRRYEPADEGGCLYHPVSR